MPKLPELDSLAQKRNCSMTQFNDRTETEGLTVTHTVWAILTADKVVALDLRSHSPS
jgi:hypothetical protein